jgi:tRNA A-37 threonylcarbamoyl transferase component Bud32
MGVVYLARDSIIDRRVALKTLRVDLDAEMADEFRERFFREAQAAGRLNHRGIVTVHDVGEDQASGLVYIAMEYVEGRDLKEVLAEGHRFRPSEAARIAADVAAALDYAHSMGVVHRDIKPANILLARDGTARITDFGVARLESSNLTMDGQFIGTPNFMSPEQVAGRKVDGRSDLFALGVVLFNLLTGQRPFAGGTMHEVTLRIVQEPPPIPSTVGAGIPPAFNPIILKCLEKDPDRRFQTGADLARVLAALARSLTDRDPTDAERTGVFQPDLETRVRVRSKGSSAGDASHTPPVIEQPPDAGSAAARDGAGRFAVPEVLQLAVEPRWVVTILATFAVVVAALLGGLKLQVDDGPFPAPSTGSIQALHGAVEAVQRAASLLASQRLLDAETAALQALDQAPASPAARTTLAAIRHALEIARSSAETQGRVESLISDGREKYRAGRFSDAIKLFREALGLDPTSELATSYLELAEERERGAGRRTGRSRPSVPELRTSGSLPPARDTAARPTPGTTRITLFFNSPLNAGAVVMTLDGDTVAEVPFDFTNKGFLGIKKKGSGVVKRVVLVPSGARTVGVELRGDAGENLGRRDFSERLPAGSDWTLRVDLPKPGAEPGFFLVRTSR